MFVTTPIVTWVCTLTDDNGRTYLNHSYERIDDRVDEKYGYDPREEKVEDDEDTIILSVLEISRKKGRSYSPLCVLLQPFAVSLDFFRGPRHRTPRKY
jgi:hypothetical protein